MTTAIRQFSKELQQKAEDELNEVPGRMKEDLQQIRNWLKKQPHLTVRSDDQFLVGVLRGCKFSLQRAKEKLDYFYTTRSLLPELFANRDPFQVELQEILKAGVLIPLPKTADSAGPRLAVFRWKVCEAEKMSVINIFKNFFMTLDVLMTEDDNSMVSGVRVLVDFEGLTLNYLSQFTPTFLKKTILCLEGAYPIRIKGLDCIHTSPLFEIIYNMSKPFMSDKLKGRINICGEGDTESIFRNFPKTVLPNEYNGEGGAIDELAAAWKKKVESYRKWFLEDVRYGSNESLRTGLSKTTSDVFGVEGSFRKLTVD